MCHWSKLPIKIYLTITKIPSPTYAPNSGNPDPIPTQTNAPIPSMPHVDLSTSSQLPDIPGSLPLPNGKRYPIVSAFTH